MNEQALKERLKFIASTKDKSFQETWKALVLERFLVRIAQSPYKNNFIFKGGLLLSYYIPIARQTTDIDLLADKIDSGLKSLASIISEVCGLNISDGFTFTFSEIEILDHDHMQYPGYRLKINVNFENMKDRIQIDIGIGDKTDPRDLT